MLDEALTDVAIDEAGLTLEAGRTLLEAARALLEAGIGAEVEIAATTTGPAAAAGDLDGSAEDSLAEEAATGALEELLAAAAAELEAGRAEDDWALDWEAEQVP